MRSRRNSVLILAAAIAACRLLLHVAPAAADQRTVDRPLGSWTPNRRRAQRARGRARPGAGPGHRLCPRRRVGGDQSGAAINRRAATRRDAALWIVPSLNPDGVASDTRGNAHGVDLNRNFPFGWRPLDGRRILGAALALGAGVPRRPAPDPEDHSPTSRSGSTSRWTWSTAPAATSRSSGALSRLVGLPLVQF